MSQQSLFSCAGTIYEPLLSPLLPWSSPPIEPSPTPYPKPLPSLQAQLEALVTLGNATELDNFLKKSRGRGVNLNFLCTRTGLAPLHRACISTDGGLEVGRVLLQHGASPSLLSSEGWAPLHLASIVGKKRDPGILDPEPFLAQIRKVEARLGKLAKIRKVETD